MSELGAFQRAFGRALLQESGATDVALIIHRNTTFKGLVAALAANYPTVRQLVGDEWFKACAIEYARMYPAGSPVLAIYGSAFPDFLAAFTPAADLPYLSDVARIDRMWLEALMAPDATPLSPSMLASPNPHTLAARRVRLHPAARWAWVRHSAASIWIHHRGAPSVAAMTIPDSDEALLLTRSSGSVAHLRLDDAGFAFIDCVRHGATLGAAAEASLRIDPQTDVASLFARLLAAGTFASSSGAQS
jgi:Putative DNA-binding domain